MNLRRSLGTLTSVFAVALAAGCGSSAGDPGSFGDDGGSGTTGPDAAHEGAVGIGSGDSGGGGGGDATTTDASSGNGGDATSGDGGANSGNDAGSGSGSGGGGNDSGSGGPPIDAGPPFSTGCDGGHTTLTGTILAPNGTDPIPNVRAYAAITINQYPLQYCDKCSQPIDPAYVSTTSAPDGTFSLDLDGVPAGATIDFAIQIGHFRKHTTLPVTACQTTAVPAIDATLPGSHAAGDIPKIAVSAGNQDHLDGILSVLGITDYDCYEGRASKTGDTATCKPSLVGGKTIADLLNDAPTLATYNMAFLSCAPGAYKAFAPAHAQMAANTSNWVWRGGRLFATDTAYDYIAQASFPNSITWAGPAGTVGGADLGCSPGGATTSYPITVDDPTLKTWLGYVNYTGKPNVAVQGFYNQWGLMSSLASGTSQIADGTVPVDLSGATPACGSNTSKDVPLTAQFDVSSCGRVVFSSYHTTSSVSSSTNSLAAQEKIMEYLIFGAAVCTL